MATLPRSIALAPAPALLGAELTASPVQSGPSPKTHGPPLPLGVPTFRVVQMDTLSHQVVVGTVYDLDPSFDPSVPTSEPRRRIVHGPVRGRVRRARGGLL